MKRPTTDYLSLSLNDVNKNNGKIILIDILYLMVKFNNKASLYI